MSSNKNEKSIKNLIRLMKKELKDLRIHDLLADPKLKEAFRRAKPKHWSELTEDEREAQAKEQAEAQQEFVREQRILRVKRILQSIIEAKCNEPNSRLFTTAEELLEFVVKYESSPSSVSNYEWNKFETILLTRLESLLQVDGKEEEPTETEQGTKREREGVIVPKPPEILQKILWTVKYGRKHWKIIAITVVVLLVCIYFKEKIQNNLKPISTSPSDSSAQKEIDGYIVTKSGSIIDEKTGLEWSIGPNRTITWNEALEWIEVISSVGRNWRLPTVKEIATLYNPNYKAGYGFYKDGKYFPPHIHPVFDKIGDGAWLWSSESVSDDYAFAYNLNQNIPVKLHKENMYYTTRVFAVRKSKVSFERSPP